MLNAKGERELAYVVAISEVLPMNADRLEEVKINGWSIVCAKNEFHVGDLGVYFEIDSILPDIKPFNEIEFLVKKQFIIKTQKIRGVYSQGLLLPIHSIEPLITDDRFKDANGAVDLRVGDFLTKELHIKKYEPIIVNKEFNTYTNNKNKNTNYFPNWVIKTDEERIQNIPYIINTEDYWLPTEKIDGTSTTFTVHKVVGFFNKLKHRFKYGRALEAKYDFYVCSRNVCYQLKDNPQLFYSTNVYTEMAEKYNVKIALYDIATRFNCNWVTIQGETFGKGIQKRSYSLERQESPQFRAFNLVLSTNGRLDSIKGKEMLSSYHIPWVPILDKVSLKDMTVEEVLTMADGKSAIDGKPREGLVFRSLDGKKSFKAVSNKYLVAKISND